MPTPSPPQVTSIICQSTAPVVTLQFVWQPTGDYTGPFSIIVQDTSGASYGSAAGGLFGGIWASTKTMDPAGTYVAIVQTSDPNITTGTIPILIARYQGVQTTFDGTTAGMTWSSPTGPRPTQARIRLRATAAVQDFPPIYDFGAGTAVPNPAILPDAQDWYAMVAPVTEIATGPWSAPALLLRSRPTISQAFATSAAGKVTVSLVTPRGKDYTDTQSFGVTLYAGDDTYLPTKTLPSVKQADTTCRIDYAMPDDHWPLPGGFAYRFTLRQANPAAVGPEGLRQPFPPAAPDIVSVVFATGDTKDTIAVTLAPPTGIPSASGALVALTAVGGTVITSKTWNRFFGSLTVDKGAAAGGSITTATAIGVATGLSTADTVPVLTTAPVVSRIAYDGASIQAAWQAVTGASGYLMTVWSAGGELVARHFGQTSGTISAPPGDMQVTIAAISGRATGPVQKPIAIIVDAPAIATLTFNADSTATVAFQQVPAGRALSYEVLDGGTVVKADTLGPGIATVTLAASLLGPQGNLTIHARFVLTADGVVSSGPWAAAVPLVTQQPSGVSTEFDGRIATVSWTRSASPLASCDTVTILSGGQPAKPSVPTADTSVLIDCSDLDPSKTYTVVVQPVAGSWAGKPAAPVSLFAPGLYLSTAAGVAPNLFPAASLDMAPADLVTYLPDLFSTKPTDPLPDETVFKLQAAGSGDVPFLYTLNIPKAGGAWTFGQDPIRQPVRAAYAALMTWLDTHNGTGYGIQLVAESIGRALPQTFAETLLYGCGLDTANGVTDLRPGHIVKVEFESYQYQGTSGPYIKYLNGFVGANLSTYEVTSALDANGRWLLGFDGFLSRITQYMSVPKPMPSAGQEQGGGGIADLFYSQFRQPYCRLVYPGTFFGQGDPGSPYPYYNVALVAAASLADLAIATTNLRNSSADFGNAAVMYFRGRTMITVCMRVLVDGASMVVPVGSTVGNLLEAVGRRPPRASTPLSGLPLSGLRLDRAAGPIAATSGVAKTGFPVDGSVRVRLDWNTNAVRTAPHEWLDLPLMPGDRLTIGGG